MAHRKRAIVRRYDTTPDNEIATGGYGLGCNGIVHVLLERVKPGAAAILDLIRHARMHRQAAVVAHAIAPASAVGERLILGNHDLPPDLEAEARGALAAGAHRLVHIGEREWFIETLAPAVRLLVFGAGDDAIPLTDLAKYLGWRVEVFDGRSHYARREKFPNADDVSVRVAAAPPPAVDPWTVAVLMSHSYSQDLDALRELADLPLLGEAFVHLSEEDAAITGMFTDLRQIVGMRNRLVHGYDQLDLDMVWDTTLEHVPKLLAQVESIFEITTPAGMREAAPHDVVELKREINPPELFRLQGLEWLEVS